jgi:membrane-bound ClpP family serine protease
MTPANVSLLNAVVLIALGLIGYFTSEDPSKTAFIPVVFGVILVACYPGVRKHNKTVAHLAVLATLLILIGLFMPLKGAIGRGDTAAIVRVVLMLVTTAAALVVFIRSFIQARRGGSDPNGSDPQGGADASA